MSDYTPLLDLLGDSGRVEDESNAVRLRRLITLMSTFVRGTGYMRQQMHDVIATSNKVGHPENFPTVMCSSRWPEIRRSLLPGQVLAERPDLCARVFCIKLCALVSFVIQEELFGTVAAYVLVMEFQKGDLPHPYCIFFLDETSKHRLQSPSNEDRVISVETPPESEAHLQVLVLKHMTRNPCGKINTSAPCMGASACKKRISKPFCAETGSSDNDYYIVYRCTSLRDGGVSVAKEGRVGRRAQMVSPYSSWVVLQSFTLLRMFACHINVELCACRIGGIKHLFKYVCKGL